MSSFYKVAHVAKPIAFSPARLLLSLLDVLAYTGHDPEDAYWLSETIQSKLIETQIGSPIIERMSIVKTSYDTLVTYDELAGRAYLAKHPL